MVGDHREIPFWLLKKKCLHFTYFITIFRVKAFCQAVSQYAILFHPINQSINQSTNQLFLHFCSILDTLGTLRHDGKRKGAELGLRHFSWYYIFSSPVVRRNDGNKFIRAFLHSSSQSINQSINQSFLQLFHSFFHSSHLRGPLT